MNKIKAMLALAGATLIAGAPALAQPGHGNGHGNGNGNGRGNGGGFDIGDIGVDARGEGRLNSQGPAHANARALERANSHSVLRDGKIRTARAVAARRAAARRNSQGAAHANARAIARSNANSALHTSTTTTVAVRTKPGRGPRG
jgi:hypothetical protein